MAQKETPSSAGRKEPVRSLGEAGDDLNDVDMLSWVEKNRSRASESSKDGTKDIRRRSMKRKKQEEEGEGYRESDSELLKSAKVKGHSLEALETNDEMILTLADRGILNESGNDVVDEEELMLENVRERENTERERARKASQKAKPLWEEDRAKRSILDKYDEEEEEAFVLGDIAVSSQVGGRAGKLPVVPTGVGQGQRDVKSKLEAAKDSLFGPCKTIGGDYYTAEEMRRGKGGKRKGGENKKKRERKLKKKALTEDDIADLELATKELSDGHLASKQERKARLAKKIGEEPNEVAEKRAKFDAALQRANIASIHLKNDNPSFDLGREDEMLVGPLKKSLDLKLEKQTSKTGSLDDLAKQVRARRERLGKESTENEMNEDMRSKEVLTFTNIGEFVRSIKSEEGAHGREDNEGHWKEEDGLMGVENIPVKKEQPHSRHARKYRKHHQDTMNEPQKEHEEGEETRADDKQGITTRDSRLGPGLGSVLSLLKDRGELDKPIEWGGRTNDSRNAFFAQAMGGYKDVYGGDKSEDKIAANVEVALTRKDEFGRIMTPKEAFRQFCHNFHGIQPSQGSKEKRLRQVAREFSQKRRDASEGVGQMMTKMQESSKTPFLTLDGTVVKPGQQR
jgi:U4/U6.U5 tri-snRNP-associated protein 1